MQVHRVNLNEGHRKKLVDAINNNKSTILSLKHEDLVGSIPLLLTPSQIEQVKRAYSNGTGTRLNLSAAQIMAMKKQGGGKVWDEIVHWLDGAANSVGKFVGNLLNSGETGFQKGIQGKRGSGLTGKNLFKGYVPRTGSVQFAVGDGLVQFPTVGQSIHQSMYQGRVPAMRVETVKGKRKR